MKYLKSFLVIGTILLSALTSLASTPSWTVNSSSFSNSMTITAVIKLDNVESQDVNDKVGAFVNGECRGAASPIFIQSENRYYVYLLIYSNEASGENISFKVYDADKDQIVDAANLRTFSIDEITGSISNPYAFLNTTPESNFQGLQFLGVNSNTSIDATMKTVIVTVSGVTDLTNLIAVYQLSDGATAKINSATQESGVSANDFSSAKVYLIIAADGTTQNWTVSVVKATVSGIISKNSMSEKIKVYPVPSSEFIDIDLTQLISNYGTLRITNLQGESIIEESILASISKINISHLPVGTYLIVVDVDDQKFNKLFIKQ